MPSFAKGDDDGKDEDHDGEVQWVDENEDDKNDHSDTDDNEDATVEFKAEESSSATKPKLDDAHSELEKERLKIGRRDTTPPSE